MIKSLKLDKQKGARGISNEFRIETYGWHSLDRAALGHLWRCQYSAASAQRPALSAKSATPEFVACWSCACRRIVGIVVGDATLRG